MDKLDKNKISDTDSFWDQLEEKPQEERESYSPLAAEKADGSIAIDRDQLLRAVGQLNQNSLEEETFSQRGEPVREQAANPEKEEQNIFSSRRQERSSAARGRKRPAGSHSGQRKEKDGKSSMQTRQRERGNTVSMSRNTMFALMGAAIVCLGSFLGIFYKLNADKQEIIAYIETELADIRAKNDAAIAEMGDTLGRMETNFDEIVSLLEETGAAIGSSSQESRAAISERIEKLDKQLQSLQKSLAVLQEDANGRKK